MTVGNTDSASAEPSSATTIDLIAAAPSMAPASVAGEDPARAVAAVRRRREADEQEPGARIAEAGQRARPVALGRVPARRGGRDRLAAADQPRTLAAANDPRVEARECALQSGGIVTRWRPCRQ